MKKSFLILTFLTFCLGMKAQQSLPDSNGSVLTFDSTKIHFGKVPQGEIVLLEVHFTNTGKSPLVISDCVTACGCDVAEAPKKTIQPGESGIIKYRLNTESRMGMQEKTITVRYNQTETIVIHIYGEIIPAKSEK